MSAAVRSFEEFFEDERDRLLWVGLPGATIPSGVRNRMNPSVSLSPRPDVPETSLLGDASTAAGGITVLSPFVTGRIFESSPVWIFVTGVILGSAGLWLGVRAVKTPKGSRGRRTGTAGIVLAIVGIVFCTFGAIVQSILNSDTAL